MHSDCLLERMKPVTMADKELFDRYLHQYPQPACEYTFADIFVRSELRHFLWTECEGHLVISLRSRDLHREFLAPIGPHPEEIIKHPLTAMREYHWTRVPEEIALSTTGTGLRYDATISDYLYSVEELQKLEGKKFDGKRNFVKRMQAQEPEVRSLTAAMAPECIRIQELWLESQVNNPSAQDEVVSLTKALQNFDQLPLTGIAVYVSGQMVGFAVGEPLTPTMYVEHFEKAMMGYTGLYPFVTHEFAKSIPSQYTVLNREQDLGIEGLRKSKESWNPIGLSKKYIWEIHTNEEMPEGEMTV